MKVTEGVALENQVNPIKSGAKLTNDNFAVYTSPKRTFLQKAKTQKELLLLSLPFFAFFFIFNYYPLWGLTMAFQEFKPALSFWEQEWVGLKHFERLFNDPYFGQVMRNTIAMSLITLVLSFASSIIFALFINEVTQKYFKKTVQTISYMPHFLSWIIVCGLIANILTTDNGVLNNLLIWLGIIDKPIHFLGNPDYFWTINGLANVWKSMGWNSIIYLAAITSINPELYEAAAIDGCGRFKRMWHITLPCIRPTIVILLILNSGWILNAGFDLQYILGSSGLVLEVSETIDIYVYRKGLSAGVQGFAFGTAAGMFKTVVSVIVLYFVNRIAGWLGEDKLI